MPDVSPSFPAEHIYAAARADMEFRTTLSAARHHLENLLSPFSHAVCSRDSTALGQLTGSVAVSLDGQLQLGESRTGKIIDWFAQTGQASAQVVTNISLRFGDSDVLYSATYQGWETGPVPRCTAIGLYQGRLKAGPQVWRWDEHHITRFRNVPESLAPAQHMKSSPDRGRKVLQSTR